MQGPGAGMNRQSTEDLGTRETTIQDAIMGELCHHTFTETHTTYSTKSVPSMGECPGGGADRG